jgi:hypothetical protein
MIVIVSPAKKMKCNTDHFPVEALSPLKTDYGMDEGSTLIRCKKIVEMQ